MNMDTSKLGAERQRRAIQKQIETYKTLEAKHDDLIEVVGLLHSMVADQSEITNILLTNVGRLQNCITAVAKKTKIELPELLPLPQELEITFATEDLSGLEADNEQDTGLEVDSEEIVDSGTSGDLEAEKDVENETK